MSTPTLIIFVIAVVIVVFLALATGGFGARITQITRTRTRGNEEGDDA